MQKNIILVKALSGEVKNDTYYTALKSAGYLGFVLQPIEFEYLNKDKLDAIIRFAPVYSGLILTSPRSVQSLKNCKGISEWAHKDNFVVGDATYQEAKTLNLNVTGQESGNASNLCKLINKGKFDKPFFYPKSNLAKDTVEATLTLGGIFVSSLETYRTIPNSNLEKDIENLKEYLPAAMVFFSPSGVDNVLPYLRNINATLEGYQFFAIGETTEKALKNNNVTVAGIASSPTPNSLLLTIQTNL